MAAISETAVRNIWKAAVRIYDEQRKAAAITASTNFITLQAALIALLSGDYVNDMTARVQGTRQKLTTVLNDASSALDVVFRYYAQTINTPEIDIQSAITRVYDHFVTNTLTIPSRLFVFGSVTAGGSNVGNGTITRLNLDPNGFVLENQAADTKTFMCVADASSGTEKNEESFEVRGLSAPPDNLTLSGSGKKTNIASLSARASQRFIRNASFSQSTPAGPTAAPTDITSWTSNITVNGTNYELIGGTGVNGFYRDFPGDTTPLALRIKYTAGTATVSQNLETLRSTFALNTPYYVHVAWRRKSSADGTLTLTLGASSASVSVSSGTNDVWNVLKIGPGTANWYKNFGQAALSLSVSWSGQTTGNLDIDDVVISPFANFDGSWYSVVGANTQFLESDSFTFADTEQGSSQSPEQGVLQAWLFRTVGRYLPSKPKAPATATTAALAGAGAGNVDNGTHSWVYTYVHQGIESAPAATSNVLTVVDKTVNGQVSLTGVSVGPTGTTARKIYRTVSGNTGNYKLVGTISNNSSTTFTDNVADASLGANAPAAISVDDPS